MGRIPENIVEEIRQRNDIVDVISEYLTVKRAGSRFVALCPFHDEKTPSFSINTGRQFYHCFGCKKSGSVFNFIMEMENLTFPEAVRLLAGKAGITIPEGREDEGNNRLYAINAMAARKYHEFFVESPEAEQARNYIVSRGYTKSTVETFLLGYAPDSWDFMVRNLENEKVSLKDALSAGLIIDKKGSGYYYDRFRSRLMFPILTVGGTIAGFGGRTLADDQAKYLNTSETAIYKKSRILFGLYRSKEAIRNTQFAFVVEGYTDYLSLYQAGVQNVIASGGTAFTAEQAGLLARFAKGVVLLFDADAAGQQAMARSIPILLRKNLEVRLASLPEGEDPDSLIKKEGREGFDKVIGGAVDFLDYQFGNLKERLVQASPVEQSRLLQPVIENIDNVFDPVAKGLYRKRLAAYVGLDESVLLQAIINKRSPRIRSNDVGGEYRRMPEVEFSPIETAVLEILLSGGRSARLLIDSLEGVIFGSRIFRALFTKLRNAAEGDTRLTFPGIIEDLEPRTGEKLAGIAERVAGRIFDDNYIRDLVSRVKKIQLDKREEVLSEEIRSTGEEIPREKLKELGRIARAKHGLGE